MNPAIHKQRFSASVPENYQRYFVPAIGSPVAQDLIKVANLKAGDRVLDVACGTGVVTRLATDQVGSTGSVTGVDLNPCMLTVARDVTSKNKQIEWLEADVESMPFEDKSYDVVLCQMGLQFFPNKLSALREMRRVLKDGGRIYITVPGPKPALFTIMSEALASEISKEAAMFGDIVFSMFDPGEITDLMQQAGFHNIIVKAEPKNLQLPPPADFLWEYIYSTPLANAVLQAGSQKQQTLEQNICEQWEEFANGEHMDFEVGMTTVSAMN